MINLSKHPRLVPVKFIAIVLWIIAAFINPDKWIGLGGFIYFSFSAIIHAISRNKTSMVFRISLALSSLIYYLKVHVVLALFIIGPSLLYACIYAIRHAIHNPENREVITKKRKIVYDLDDNEGQINLANEQSEIEASLKVRKK
ncbi:hypothetical protein [Thermoflavimicrobium dichotomicum]|uniref:Uncharacterized protein n=1 Tax=Thermoflavimicrobium dichotomicum TaxID=46223 RepID=A0A1I3SVS2_9BACL|nr:hypothetical protein [Thermoflavimicrobium dichotomicum]SFJ61447.1 hypothetical protein SAMN05421852_11423 [Thermoflavimicrobium dichotomicum]